MKIGSPLFFILCATPVAAGTPAAATEILAHLPLAVPDRIILTIAQDPAHSQSVTWRTNTSVDNISARAEIALASASPERGDLEGFSDSTTTVNASTNLLETNLGPAHYHSVTFSSLIPNTLYAYRVGDGVNWSAWYHFRTASDAPTAFSFIYFGDAQNDLKTFWSRVVRGAYAQNPQVRLLVHAGDLINKANQDAEWGDWFRAGGWINGMIPSLAAPGNHEYFRDSEGQSRISHH